MARSKKDKEMEKYKTSAMIHTRQRLHQRYPHLSRIVSYKDLKGAHGVNLYPTTNRESFQTRHVIAILINDELVYIVKSISKNIVHTVLTRAMVEEQVAEWKLNITIDESTLRDAINSKYRTIKTYMEDHNL